jgi:hypothetical protein
MSDPTRNRAIGALICLLGLGELFFIPNLSEGLNLLLSFAGGACLGAGGTLLMTGKPLWNSDTWWAATQSKPSE